MNRLGISLLVMCPLASVAVAQSGLAVAASGPASRPTGVRWHYWTRCDRGRLVAHESGGLWFSADKLLWRYDLKTGQVRSLSILDDVSAITGPNALVPGKDCASVVPLAFAGRVFLPHKGWREVPLVRHAGYFTRWRLGLDGSPLFQEFIPGRPGRICRYTDGWRLGVTLPSCKEFLPLADGYLLFGTGKSGRGIPIFYDLAGKPKSASPVDGARFHGRTYRVGNNADALTVEANWTTQPTAASNYEIEFQPAEGSFEIKAQED